MALRQVEAAYRYGHDFGIGIDGVSGSTLGKVVKGVPDGVDTAVGVFSQFEISRLQSTSDLEQMLGINAEASYGVGLFNASARFDFVKKTKVQTESLFMAVTAKVTLAFLQIDDPKLEDDAAVLVDRPDIFTNRYGNMFVRGVARGGLFVGILNLATSSREEAESIATELKGSYGLFSAEAKAKFENVQKNHSSRLSMTVYREGGPVGDTVKDVTDPLGLYELLQRWLKSFEESPEKASVPYMVTIAPTTIATGPFPPNGADLEHAQDVLTMCARARSLTLDRYNLLDHILNNSSRYDFTESPRAEVLEALNGCQADLDLIAQTASNAINHPKSAKMPAAYAVSLQQLYPRGLLPNPMPVAVPGASAPSIPQGVWTIRAPLLRTSGLTQMVSTGDGKLYSISPSVDHGFDNDWLNAHPGQSAYEGGSIDRYEPAADRWTTIGQTPVRLGMAAAAAPNGEIFFTGEDRRGNYVGSWTAYYPETGAFRDCAPMPSRRTGVKLVQAANGRIYAIGGRTGTTIASALSQRVEEYDPATDSWKAMAEMPTVRDFIGVVASTKGQIYVLGGWGGTWPSRTISTVEEFDPAANLWTKRASMRVPRCGINAAAGNDGRIYAIGGGPFNEAALPIVEEYDPTTDKWVDRAPLKTPRSYAGVATLPDGTICVAGGSYRRGEEVIALSDMEVFRP